MAVQLARRGLCSSFDDAMKWTPRKMFAVLSVEGTLRQADLREFLAIQWAATHGDQKAIQKALKADE